MAERVEPNAERPFESVVAILGGTGELGRGLATRWATAGVRVVIGSRDEVRAAQIAAGFPGEVRGMTNSEAIEQSDVVVVAVPWSAFDATLTENCASFSERIVVSCVNPLQFDDRGPFVVEVAAGSAVEHAQALLPTSTVIGAFHHVSAPSLLDPQVQSIDSDVLVVGDERAAVDHVIALADLIPGVRGVYAGRRRNARQVEALTANLIAVNRRYRTQSGLRITGVDR